MYVVPRLLSVFSFLFMKWTEQFYSDGSFLHFLQIRYRPNAPLVLKGITCTFKEGSRVGVVGRTGSGKSTLISALFRLVEPSRGDILIDGLNICSMGLKDLRMRLSIKYGSHPCSYYEPRRIKAKIWIL
jgi:ABC-type multidrug transport system fused ATPase/permease subunit